MDKAREIGDAKIRAQQLLRKMDAVTAARRMAAEFHICIYAVRGAIFGSFFETDKIECIYNLTEGF